ncbi:hypothetical protein HPO96_35285 [Kribbella sandramycini]|uniref:Secreted protein n=1 Tax=Kribbella sandramycini TaxID=60450 RepID=A0A7Y4L6Z2_9ACTN|nr:hypothetical protein [Kribbella sandramycini]MBB6566738.1 hypothetical protein [Kribbella sandramycini]NOL45524.1 hypothetical protein [Kribbella sandramycini]
MTSSRTMLAGGLLLAALVVPTAPAQAAVPDLQLVSRTVGPASTQSQTVIADCPLGRSILGAGAELVGARGQAGVSTYTQFEREWGSADADEDADGTPNAWSLTAFAICTSGPHRQSLGEFSAYDSSPQKAVTVRCPAGTVTTGAGAGVSSGGQLVLDDAAPSADLTSVTVDVFEAQGGRVDSWMVNAAARCGAPLPGLQRVAATSATDSAVSKSVTATCPAGKKVVGTGHEIANGKGQVVLDDVVPSSDLSSVRAEAFEDQDGTTNAWSITAYAVCATA